MDLMLEQQLDSVARAFQVDTPRVNARAFGSGHINGSFRLWDSTGQGYLLQRLNSGIFQDVPALMANVERVTRHLAAKVADRHEVHRRVLSLVTTRDGGTWHLEPDSSCWRMSIIDQVVASLDRVGAAATLRAMRPAECPSGDC